MKAWTVFCSVVLFLLMTTGHSPAFAPPGEKNRNDFSRGKEAVADQDREPSGLEEGGNNKQAKENSESILIIRDGRDAPMNGHGQGILIIHE